MFCVEEDVLSSSSFSSPTFWELVPRTEVVSVWDHGEYDEQQLSAMSVSVAAVVSIKCQHHIHKEKVHSCVYLKVCSYSIQCCFDQLKRRHEQNEGLQTAWLKSKVNLQITY